MSCSSVEFADLPGGAGEVAVIQPRCHIILFGLGQEAAEAQRLFEERERDIERLLPLLDPQRNLPAAQARTDVIVAAHAEGIEAQRLLPLAGNGDHDRLPYDVVRFPAAQLPVGVEHYMQMRPGIDPVPSIAILGHGLLHPLWLWLFRHYLRLLSPDGRVRHAAPLRAYHTRLAPAMRLPRRTRRAAATRDWQAAASSLDLLVKDLVRTRYPLCRRFPCTTGVTRPLTRRTVSHLIPSSG